MLSQFAPLYSETKSHSSFLTCIIFKNLHILDRQRTRPLPKSVALRRQKLASSNSLTNPEGEMSMSGQETRLLAESSKVAKPKLGPLSIKRTSDSSESDKPENFSEVSAPESSLDHPSQQNLLPFFIVSKCFLFKPLKSKKIKGAWPVLLVKWSAFSLTPPTIRV